MIEYEVFSLSELLQEDYINEDDIKSSLSRFKCRLEKDMEDFLVRNSIAYDNSNIGKTYLLINKERLDKESSFEIIAFFTIAQASIGIENLNKNQKKKLLGNVPNRDSLKTYSAFLIGQLGRSDEYTKEDIAGKDILNECYQVIKEVQMVIGGRMLVLECRKVTFDKFYSHEGFQLLYDTPDCHDLYTVYQKIDFTSE